MISVTLTDKSGRTLSGQNLEAFYHSVKHANPLSVGINCALGIVDMKPHILELSDIASCFVSMHANAGLPDAFGNYSEVVAEHLLSILEKFLKHLKMFLRENCPQFKKSPLSQDLNLSFTKTAKTILS